jgi:purine-cytosine permease-like protein
MGITLLIMILLGVFMIAGYVLELFKSLKIALGFGAVIGLLIYLNIYALFNRINELSKYRKMKQYLANILEKYTERYRKNE